MYTKENKQYTSNALQSEKIHNIPKYTTLWEKDTSDYLLHAFWHEIKKDNVARMTFFDHMPETQEEFCAWARQKNNNLRFIISSEKEKDFEKRFRAMYWINNPIGKNYMIHFCFLKQAFQEQEEIGLYVVRGLLLTKKINNEFVIDSLIGVTPKVYRHAMNFIHKLGFVVLATLPNACFFEQKKAHKDAYLSLLTRETLK